MPVPGTSTLLPKSMPSVCVDVTTYPRASATTTWVVCSSSVLPLGVGLGVRGGLHGEALSGLILAASSAHSSSDRRRSSAAGLVSRSPAYRRRAAYASLVASAYV